MESKATIVEVITDFRITVPKPLRDALGIEIGDLLEINVKKIRRPITEQETTVQAQ